MLTLYKKALNLEWLSLEEGVFLFKNAPLSELIFIGNELRKQHNHGNNVTWMIDRNVNITNVCCSQCKFCNFFRKPGSGDSYITSIEEYKNTITELFDLGGNQVLLQGGLHPGLKLNFHIQLFKELKTLFPKLKLHALGPPEIIHIAKLEKKSPEIILKALMEAGLDSLPGAGAEILSDRVRRIISPAKCTTQEWLDVMKEAHKLNLPTSATMMFGHVETLEERIQHLILLRETQSVKPDGAYGFIAFIPWPFQDNNTEMKNKLGIKNSVKSEEYIRTIAISRIMLPNIQNIQASWLTVGKNTAQVCLNAGANDLGSIMIEENVVSSAGAKYSMNAEELQQTISEAGFTPKQRNQKYETCNF